jgi:probable phosphoglycerate mutase
VKEKTIEFVLVRHGQTVWNREQIFRGKTDIPLSEEGLAQARATAEALRNTPLTAVLTSPLRRARQTAEAIAALHGISVEPDTRLSDISFGLWEGLGVEEVARRYPELYGRWRAEPQTVVFPGGESLAEVRHRAEELLQELAAERAGEVVCMVSHRVVNKLILLSVLGLGNEHFWRIEQDTCCVNRFRLEGGRYIITVINDTCHLKPSGTRPPDF